MGGKPATTSSYTGGVGGPSGSQYNTWSPQNPAYGGSPGDPNGTAEFWLKNQGLQAYQQAANTPYQQTNPWLQQGMQGMQNASTAGQTGINALAGDQNAYNALANPYQNAVLQQMQNQFGFQNQGALNAAADQAQGQNAYGGTRSDILGGTALSQNQMGQSGQYANLLNQGYLNTMNQASNLAQLGQGANQGLMAGGQYANTQANEATMWKPQTLAAGFNSYPEMTLQGSNSQPSGASNASKGVGTIAEMAPLIAMFA